MPEETKKKQTRRYSEEELSIIKNTFADNDELLKAIRKEFLQDKLNAVDLALLEMVKKPAILKILRKTILPEIDTTAPIHQVIDLWMTLQINDKLTEIVMPQIWAREKVIKYLEQQFNRLEDRNAKLEIKFEELTPSRDKLDNDNYADLVARNTIVNHIEMQLNALLFLAGSKDETVEQTMERLNKDSNK